MTQSMNLAVVGTGYVAHMYAATMGKHSDLTLLGVQDTNPKHLEAFCRTWRSRPYASLDDVLSDPAVELVLNLTNPRSHYEVTRRCLESGKHVYSEKPLAMTAADAAKLVKLAKQKERQLSTAPCSLLSETAQTMWKAIREGVVGKVRLVYANFDDGMIAPNMSPWLWVNDSGVPWPAADEFEVGCTYEHAGYVLTWLAAFFGPAKSVTAFASCQIPDKGVRVDAMAPDFSVGCIEYSNDVVVRVTCGIVAPLDKSLLIIGDDGVISTSNVRDDAGPVYVQHIPPRAMHARLERWLNPIRKSLEGYLPAVPWSGLDWHFRRKYPFARRPTGVVVDRPGKPVDFCRGPSEMAEAIRDKRACRLSADMGLHITEVIEALQHPDPFGGKRRIDSTFDPIEPLPWIS